MLDQVSSPFAAPTSSSFVSRVAPHSGVLRILLWTVWACGFLSVSFTSWRRWRRVVALVRVGSVVDVGIPIPAVSSPSFLEPGVFGLFRPVLLLPEGIFEQLTPEQWKSVVAHELCHVRHRDNLIGVVQMFIEALFWFHPLVWWIGKRICHERERGCGEEVLQMGSDPRIYAQGILKVCELYLESPVACVAGVSGSNLRRRIEGILRHRVIRNLSWSRKALIGCAATAALVIPVSIGVVNAPAFQTQDAPDWQTKAGGKMSFEVASVKLNKEGLPGPPSVPLDAGERYQPTGGYFRAGFSLWAYIQFAYKLWGGGKDQREVIDHLPKWITTENYSIEARSAGDPTKDQYRLMMQSVLADRFKLAAHFETREEPVYAITLAKAGKLGPKMIRHEDGRVCGAPGDPIGPVLPGLIGGKDDAGRENFPPMCDSLAVIRRRDGSMFVGYRDATMGQLSGSLSGILGQPLLDHTGLTGRFDFTLAWVSESAASQDPIGPTTPLDALRDQLGMKVESTKGPVKILVVDKVEKPSEN